MKKLCTKTSLLVSASAVAGLAMGAGIALAAHPPIQLFTYEEVARQMTGPALASDMSNLSAPANQPLPVMVDPVSKQGFPYSPKATCTGGGVQSGRCHSDNTTDHKTGSTTPLKGYTNLSEHAFHAELGFNEWMDNSDHALFVSTGSSDGFPAGTQTGLAATKPWLQSHGHNGKW
jgi:hypothetical protein